MAGDDVTGEDELIVWLRRQTEARGWHRLGDDAAELPSAAFIATVDTQIEGVHFVADLAPERVARRLLAVNLSDLAAMGAEPAFALLALSAPPGFEHRRFFTGLLEACDAFGVELAGGDLSSQPRLTAALTLLGRRQGRIVGRHSGRSGHRLWLGGTVGESGLGCRLVAGGARPTAEGVHLPGELAVPSDLTGARRAVVRHLEPTPQLALGAFLAEQEEGAAIDVSDGLARDLHRLCRASGVGAEIDVAALEPRPEMARLAGHLGLRWRDLALGGGEDYVLLFSLLEGIAPPASLGCRPLGRLTAGGGVFLRETDGRLQELPPQGFDHLATDDPAAGKS